MLAVARVVTISVPACSTTVEESSCLCELPAARLLSVRKCRRGGDDRTIVDEESRVRLGEEVTGSLVGELGNEGGVSEVCCSKRRDALARRGMEALAALVRGPTPGDTALKVYGTRLNGRNATSAARNGTTLGCKAHPR